MNAPDAGNNPIATLESKRINLLPYISPSVHAIKGKWLFNAGILRLEDQQPYNRIAVPYLPPEEYNLSVTASLDNNAPLALILVHDRIDFIFELSPERCAFANVQNQPPLSADNFTNVKLESLFFLKERVDIDILVRFDGFRALINGKEVTYFKTDYHDISIDQGWRLPVPCLGIGGFNSSLHIHSIVVTEIMGEGFLLPRKAFHRT